jgi:signal peptidase II
VRHLQTARGTPLSRRTPALFAAGVALVGLGVDQASKRAVLETLSPGQPVEIVGSLVRFNLIFNPGAAFSLGTSMTLALSIFAIVALLACVFIALSKVRTLSQALAVGLMMAGISGNLHDRIFRAPGPLLGHVVDFIQLPHFAIFNVADMCITSAAFLIILLSLRNPSEEKKRAELG